MILPYAVLQIHWFPRYTKVLFLILLDALLPHFFFMILQIIAGAIDVSNFLRAFLMVSLNSLSSGSMKQIPHNFRAFSRWSFSCDHFCFSFSLARFPIDFQSSGHRCSGLDVSCFLVNLPHISVRRFFFQ